METQTTTLQTLLLFLSFLAVSLLADVPALRSLLQLCVVSRGAGRTATRALAASMKANQTPTVKLLVVVVVVCLRKKRLKSRGEQRARVRAWCAFPNQS